MWVSPCAALGIVGGYWAITIALKELISELQLSTSIIDYGDIVLGRFLGFF